MKVEKLIKDQKKNKKNKGNSRIKLLNNKELINEVNRLLVEEGKSPDIVAYKKKRIINSMLKYQQIRYMMV